MIQNLVSMQKPEQGLAELVNNTPKTKTAKTKKSVFSKYARMAASGVMLAIASGFAPSYDGNVPRLVREANAQQNSSFVCVEKGPRNWNFVLECQDGFTITGGPPEILGKIRDALAFIKKNTPEYYQRMIQGDEEGTHSKNWIRYDPKSPHLGGHSEGSRNPYISSIGPDSVSKNYPLVALAETLIEEVAVHKEQNRTGILTINRKRYNINGKEIYGEPDIDCQGLLHRVDFYARLGINRLIVAGNDIVGGLERFTRDICKNFFDYIKDIEPYNKMSIPNLVNPQGPFEEEIFVKQYLVNRYPWLKSRLNPPKYNPNMTPEESLKRAKELLCQMTQKPIYCKN